MRKLLASLSSGQRIAVVAAALVVGAGIFGLARWQKEKDFKPLYTGLAPEDAGAVVQRLKESGAEYRLSEDGRAVMVPSARVAELRLAMASAGLPRNGRIGFELFDKTNFGATEFTEQVNYRRALEGELERSIMSLAAVEMARVHLTFPKESVFVESRQPAKASVLVKLRPGSRLSPANVAAVSHLVASAVENLAPESVSILDMQGNLLNRPRRPLAGQEEVSSDAMLEYRQAVERDLAAKITNTLEPLLGPDKFRVSVAAECDFTSGEQSEENFDPARSVMLASQKTEEYAGAPSTSGTPGTASNLPRPASRPASGTSGLARQTESITYQSSRTVRRIRLPQGALKKLSVAVVLDHEVSWSGADNRQRTLSPPSPEKMKVIHDLAAAAVGLNPDRGDQLIVESLPFENTAGTIPTGEPPATPPSASSPSPLPAWLQPLQNQKILVGAGGGLALLLLLLLAFSAWRRSRRRRKAAVTLTAELPAAAPESESSAALPPQPAAMPTAELPPAPPKKSEVLAGRLRETVKADPAASAQILRSWLSEDEE